MKGIEVRGEHANPYCVLHVVFREDQPGPQHRTLTTNGGLVRFMESVEYDTRRGFDWGPFDVYVLDTNTLVCARYDVAPLLALAAPPGKKKAARA